MSGVTQTMTLDTLATAYDSKNADGSTSTDPFAQGAGHVDPTKYFDAGLLYLNGVAVCNPQPIDAAFDPDRIQFCLRTADVGEAEFEHLKIYSAGGLPTPQQRLAAGNFGN